MANSKVSLLIILTLWALVSAADVAEPESKCLITKDGEFKSLVTFQLQNLLSPFALETGSHFISSPCHLEYPGSLSECSETRIQGLGVLAYEVQNSVLKLMTLSRTLSPWDFESKVQNMAANFLSATNKLKQVVLKDENGCYEVHPELLKNAWETAVLIARHHRSCAVAKPILSATTELPLPTQLTEKVRQLYPDCLNESDFHIHRLVDFFKWFNPSNQPSAILQQAYSALLDAIKSSPYLCTQDYVQLAYKVQAMERNATSWMEKQAWTGLKQRFNPKVFDLFASQKRWAVLSVEKPGYALYATNDSLRAATSWRYATFKKLEHGIDATERDRFAWQISPQDQHSQYDHSTPPPDGGSVFDFRSAYGSYFFGRYLTSFQERLSPMVLPTRESLDSRIFNFRIFFSDKVVKLVDAKEAGSFVPERLKGEEFLAIEGVLKDLAGKELQGTSTFYLQEM